MSRKDTILIAVIINAGLLAILFATAIIYDTEKLIDHTEFDATLAEASPVENDQMKLIASHQPQIKETDHIYYENPTVSIPLEQEELYFHEPDMSKAGNIEYVETGAESQSVPKDEYVEVSVKKGDTLEKIAKANGTSINAIKKASRLNSERLSIGQILKIPLKKDQVKKDQTAPEAPSAPKNPETVYHTVKSGDNPWKIARQYGVKYEDILILNNLDEDKARNLKIGDRIRVK